MASPAGDTHLLLLDRHVLPAPGPLLADFAFARGGAKVRRDDRTRGLHVQEIRRQRSLRHVGVVHAFGLPRALARLAFDGTSMMGAEPTVAERVRECQQIVGRDLAACQDGVAVGDVGA